jgi:hypothetical protein
MQHYLCHSDLTGQETELDRIFFHRIEKPVIRCLCVQNMAHLRATVAHPQQWVALSHSCCSSNHKNDDEVVTAGNLHWPIFGTDRFLLLVYMLDTSYRASMLA